MSVVSLRHLEFGFGGEVGEVVTVRYGGGNFVGYWYIGNDLSQTPPSLPPHSSHPIIYLPPPPTSLPPHPVIILTADYNQQCNACNK